MPSGYLKTETEKWSAKSALWSVKDRDRKVSGVKDRDREVQVSEDCPLVI